MRRTSSTAGSRLRRGISLTDLILSVATLSVLAGAAVSVFPNVRKAADETRLEKDARTLNLAVHAYLNSGGSIPSDANAEAVLAKLKVRPDVQSMKTLPGLRSTAVELRLKGKPVSSGSVRRITWDTATRSFRVKNSGYGWSEMLFDETEASQEHGTEMRRMALVFASQLPWVWDYTDTLTSVAAPRNTPVSAPDTAQIPLADPDFQLLPPEITPSSGEYDYRTFPLGINIQNPNAAGTSIIRYQVDDGDWQTWSGGPLNLPRDLTHNVRAFAESADGETYDQSAIMGTNYVSYFIRGQADAVFVNPAGEPRLEQVISLGGRKLDWGKVESPGQSQSSLEFIPGAPFEAGPSESFSVATLRYTNGVSRAGTNASSVTATISLPLTVPVEAGLSVNVPLRMQNSVHYPWTPAGEYKDYLWVPDTLPVAQPVVVLDRIYRLTLHTSAASGTQDGTDLKIPIDENGTAEVTITAILDPM